MPGICLLQAGGSQPGVLAQGWQRGRQTIMLGLGGVKDRKEGERNYIQGVKGNEREKLQECEPGSWAGSTEPRPGSAERAGTGRNRLLESQG